MKKIFILIFCIFILCGCESSPKKTDIDILTDLSNTILLPEETSENLILPSEFEYNNQIISAQWISEDESIISNVGTIFATNETNYVSLMLVLTLNESQITKSFNITVLPLDNAVIAKEILDKISIPSTTDNHLTLDLFIKFQDKNYKISWKSNDENIMTSRGKIYFDTIERIVILTATINYEGSTYSKDFNIKVLPFNTDVMTNFLNQITIPSNTSSSIELPSKATINSNNFEIQWQSSNEAILDNSGNISIVTSDTEVTLKATMILDNVSVSKDFLIVVNKTDENIISDLIYDIIKVPTVVTSNIFLPTNLGNNLVGTWKSNNDDIISTDGVINNTISIPQKTTLTFEIKIGDKLMTFNFDTTIQPIKHFIMNNIFDGELDNLFVNNEGKLEITDGKLLGTYYSKEIQTHQFSEAVATWCAITSEVATCELFVSLKINNTFSEYITYGEWGLGLKNGSTDQSNNLIKLVDDEIKILNNKYADGLKFKLVLKRKSEFDKSPIVSLVTFALNLVNYTYDVDSSLLKQSVKYDVPKLYQHDVPTIGNSICSITSSTMLLKYKGYNFTDKNPLEHEYLASIFYDYGNKIYGNWVFNCVGMSSYGERAYVKRFFSVNEFLYSLQEVGPMAASIKGTVKYYSLTQNKSSSYTSAGHLLVVTGYEITPSATYIFINDPNVNGVSIRMTLPDFLNIWRNVSYIIE